jgi:hypothetical protein
MMRKQSRGRQGRARKARQAAKARKPSPPAKGRKPRSAAKTPGSVEKVRSKDDAFVDKIVATAMEGTEILEKVTAYRASHPTYLSVLDAQNEKDFIKNAKKVYRETHRPNHRRGRRSEENQAMIKLMALSEKLNRRPTHGEMVRTLMDHKLMGQRLSINTAGKYARLYRLSGMGVTLFSKADQEWLRKEFGTEALSQIWWMDRRWQWWEEKARVLGVLKEIRDCFAQPPSLSDLQRMRREAEKQRLLVLQQHRDRQQ